MTMQEQIELSGLEIMSSLSSSLSSSSSSKFQWNSTNQWSPLLGGGQSFQACATIGSDSGENDAGGQTIVVIGGLMQSGECTNSVIVWDPSTKTWRNGPSLNDKRRSLVAVACHDKVYAFGGVGGDNNDDNNTTLDTIESIQVSSLLETMETSTMTRQNNSQWTRLQCRLSSPRSHCAAVVVHNRFIVILGGRADMGHNLSSVDIVDTAPPCNNNNNSNGEATIVAGPSMNSTRDAFGAAVVDNRIFVVGGNINFVRRSTSVESLLLQQQPQDKDKDHTHSNSNMSCTFPNSSWRMEPHLSLPRPRHSHAVAKVGSCLVVAGGWNETQSISVEVLDVHWGVVWSLPDLTIRRPDGCSMVALSDCLLVLGGHSAEVESLALTVYQKHERCFKFLKFLIEIEFLGRPSRKRDV